MSRSTVYRYGTGGMGITRPGSSSEDVTATYDTSGRVASVTSAAGTTTYGYADASGQRTTTVTDPLAHATVYVFDLSSSRMKSITNAVGKVTTLAYDTGDVHLTRVTAPEGNYTEYTYDGRGNVTQTRAMDKAGSSHLDSYAAYDATCTYIARCNQPNTTTDALGHVTDYSYDATTGELLSVTQPGATSTGTRPKASYTYAAVNGVSMVSTVSTCQTGATCAGTADEVKAVMAYDANGLPTSVTRKAGDGSLIATVTTTYDDVGNVAIVDGPLSGSADSVSYRYDADREMVGAIGPDPDGAGGLDRRAVRTTFDGKGRATLVEAGTVTGTTDTAWSAFAPSQSVTTVYDDVDRPLTRTLASGSTTYGVTQLSYDHQRLICVATRMNASTWSSLPASACTAQTAGSQGPDRIVHYGYDAADRQTVVTSAYGTSAQADEASAAYTDNGQVLSVTDAEGNKTGYGYDGFDRLAKTSFPSPTKGSGTVSTTDYETLAYDDAGNVTSRRLRDGNSIAYSYDNLNRLTAKDLPGSDPDVSYSYDLLGRPLTAATSTQTVTLGYDALGRLTSDAQPVGTMSYQYDLAGHRTRVTWPDAYYVTYDYDAAGRMTTVKQSGSTTLASYAYDSLGRRVSLTMGNGVVTSYGYDAVSRLTSLGHDFAGTADDVTFGYGYTNAGQIASTTRSNDAYAWPDAATGTNAYASNGLNQLTVAGTASLSFDARGNTTAIGSDSYAYDSENRLLSKTSGSTTTTLGYDPVGRLTYYPASPSSPTRFLYDGGQITAAYKYPTGAPSFLSRRYVTGAGPDEVLVENPDGTVAAYMATDERGSVIARSEGSGAVTGKDSYDEYGRRGSTSSFGAFGYTGQYDLTTIGVYYYKARMYSPPLGRFLQTDPIGYGDGLNWYNYVGSDPVNRSDPSGMLDTLDKGWWKCYGNCGGGYANSPLWLANNPARDSINRGLQAGSGGSSASFAGTGISAGPAHSPVLGMPWDIVVTARSISASFDWRGFHDYSTPLNVICPVSWGCSAELVGEVYSEERNGIPGRTSASRIISGNSYGVTAKGVYLGTVRSIVGKGGLTINNITNSDHVMYDGYVNRNAFQDNMGNWWSVTHGAGRNWYGGVYSAMLNSWLGPDPFNEADRRIYDELYQRTHR